MRPSPTAPSGGAAPDATSAQAVKALAQSLSDLPLDLANGTSLGKASAPVKLVSYEDFQCPYCLNYTVTQETELITRFVKTGELQITFKQLPILGRGESARAAIASQCAADQNKFWQYHNKLFSVEAAAGQLTGEKIDAGRFSDDNLKQYAADVGIDRAGFDQCMASGKFDQLLLDTQREARQFGFTGTPSFLVNGFPLGSGAPANVNGWQSVFNQAKAASATAAASRTP